MIRTLIFNFDDRFWPISGLTSNSMSGIFIDKCLQPSKEARFASRPCFDLSMAHQSDDVDGGDFIFQASVRKFGNKLPSFDLKSKKRLKYFYHIFEWQKTCFSSFLSLWFHETGPDSKLINWADIWIEAKKWNYEVKETQERKEFECGRTHILRVKWPLFFHCATTTMILESIASACEHNHNFRQGFKLRNYKNNRTDMMDDPLARLKYGQGRG